MLHRCESSHSLKEARKIRGILKAQLISYLFNGKAAEEQKPLSLHYQALVLHVGQGGVQVLAAEAVQVLWCNAERICIEADIAMFPVMILYQAAKLKQPLAVPCRAGVSFSNCTWHSRSRYCKRMNR